MKLVKTLKFDCSMCYGEGYLYYGGQDDYNVEPCDCNLSDELFDGSLFVKEND